MTAVLVVAGVLAGSFVFSVVVGKLIRAGQLVPSPQPPRSHVLVVDTDPTPLHVARATHPSAVYDWTVDE